MANLARGLLIVVTTLAASVALGDGSCKFNVERSADVDLTGVEKVVVLAGAGNLVVMGSADAQRIEARGKACASSQKLLDETLIIVSRDGNVATVRTGMPKLETDGHASIDLAVALPSGLPVDVTDSSGDADLHDLKSLAILDSSGNLNISSIAGKADVRDSSGEIVIDTVGGVTLMDSSGEIEVRGVTGDVVVTSDSSGDIRIRDVGGLVHILQDSSGDIRVAAVKGSVTIDADSSGSINVADIGGDFTVTDDSSGGVKFDNVTGRVAVP